VQQGRARIYWMGQGGRGVAYLQHWLLEFWCPAVPLSPGDGAAMHPKPRTQEVAAPIHLKRRNKQAPRGPGRLAHIVVAFNHSCTDAA
jgi:hypothetical protein